MSACSARMHVARRMKHQTSTCWLLCRLDYRTQRDVLDIAGDLFVETNLLVSPTVFENATYRQHVDQGRPLASGIEHHAARAVLYAQGYDPNTHQGVLSLFNQHLVPPGHLEPLAARVLARLQKYREQADYGESFVVDLAGVVEETAAARQFVDRAEQFAVHSLSAQP